MKREEAACDLATGFEKAFQPKDDETREPWDVLYGLFSALTAPAPDALVRCEHCGEMHNGTGLHAEHCPDTPALAAASDATLHPAQQVAADLIEATGARAMTADEREAYREIKAKHYTKPPIDPTPPAGEAPKSDTRAHRGIMQVLKIEGLYDPDANGLRDDRPNALTDEMREAVERGRMATGDRNGSRLHPERMRRGSDNPAAKLTEGDVQHMLLLRNAYGWKLAVIAQAFGVSFQAVSKIVRGERWSHIGRI